MGERQLEAAYRARFEAQRSAARALLDLYDEISAGRAVGRAWMFGVARPRVPRPVRNRMTRDDAREVFRKASRLAPLFADTHGMHPIQSVDVDNPRAGLRRWVAPDTEIGTSNAWRSAWATVHDDGSVTLASAVGGAPNRQGHAPAGVVGSDRAERVVANLMALLRAAGAHHGVPELDVRIGMECPGDAPLILQRVDTSGYPLPEWSIPLARYTPVTASIRADADDEAFMAQVCDVAEDVVNQGGIQNLRTMQRPG
jgi:hypothetical protein